MRLLSKLGVASTVFALAAFSQAVQAETVKIAFMDPLSGPFANVGQNQLKSWQFVAEYFNANKLGPIR
jgi:branched-chain amino acid transport system substrate-binding protein